MQLRCSNSGFRNYHTRGGETLGRVIACRGARQITGSPVRSGVKRLDAYNPRQLVQLADRRFVVTGNGSTNEGEGEGHKGRRDGGGGKASAEEIVQTLPSFRIPNSLFFTVQSRSRHSTMSRRGEGGVSGRVETVHIDANCLACDACDQLLKLRKTFHNKAWVI